jgi:hypothetical protein
MNKDDLKSLLKPSMSQSQQTQGLGLILIAILEQLEELNKKPSTGKAKG